MSNPAAAIFKHRAPWLVGLFVFLMALTASAQTARENRGGMRTWQNNVKTYSHVDAAALEKEIKAIYAMGPRAVGQSGHAKIRDYLRVEIRRLAASSGDYLQFNEQLFTVTAPVDVRKNEAGELADGNSRMQIAGKTLFPFAVYPNLVAPSFVGGAEGITAPLVDGGDGSLRSLDGKTIKGAVVLLDFNSDKQWENAAKLGAAAVLFRHPETTSQAQATTKFFLVPLEVPRYLLSPGDTRTVSELLATAGSVSPLVTLKGGAEWKKIDTSNLLALLPGTDPDPRVAKSLMVVQLYYDSMCVAPGAPHGADSSLQLVAGLNLLRGMVADPTTRPKCSVLFAFNDAHSQALLGARNLGYLFWHRKEGSLGELQATASKSATAAADMRTALRMAGGDNTNVTEGADLILNDQIEALASRGGVRTARFLQQVQNSTSPDAAELAYLRTVRDGYATLKAQPTGRGKMGLILAESRKARAPSRFADAQLSPELIRETLLKRLDDLDREARISASDNAVAKWLFEGRQDTRIQGLFLELAPDSDQVSWAGAGHFGLTTSSQRLFPNMHASHLPVANTMGKTLGIRQPNPLDDSFSIEGTTQRGNFLAPQVSEGNALQLAGVPSFGLVSMNTARTFLDTPVDTPASIDFAKAADTIRFLCAFVPWITEDLSVLSLDKPQNGGPTNLVGRAVEYDVLSGLSPNQPVPGAMAYFPLQWLVGGADTERSIAGVRYAMVDQVDLAGNYSFRMIPDGVAKWHRQTALVYGFRVDANGSVDYALDQATNGVEVLSNKVYRKRGTEQVSVAIAPMRGVALFDLVDPRTLAPLNEIRVLQATSLARLDTWSTYLPINNVSMDETIPIGVETCGVVYGPKNQHVVMLASAGFAGVRAACLNTEARINAQGDPYRKGFTIGQVSQVDFTALQVATDMIRINEGRMQIMEKQGIRDKLLGELAKESRTALDRATGHYEAKSYSNAYREATHAWGVALRAYTPVKNQGKDAVLGSVFFMALCLPFAFFCERLTIRAKNPNWRIVGTLGWFAAVFLLLFLIHPAFKISLNPMIVLLAFVMLVLVLVVFSIVYRKFVLLIRQYRNQLEGSHAADFKRFSAGGVALNLSLSTMARRRARTALTGATITMLAFAIVTFSSISSGISYKQTPILGLTPSYTGLLLRLPNWADMPRSIAGSFSNEFGEKNLVLPRMWKLRSQDPWALGVSGNTTMLIRRADADLLKESGTTEINGVVGMTPEESQLLDMKKILLAGTWLRPNHDGDLLLSPETAELLDIRVEDLGTPRAELRMLQQKFTAVGIIDSHALDAFTDLDGEGLSPADYAAAGIVGKGANSSDLVNIPTFDLSQRIPHLSFRRVVITTIPRTEAMQGVYKSVAVKFGDGVDPHAELERLMRRLTIPMFAGFVRDNPAESTAGLYESRDKPDVKGYGKLIVPILLAIVMIVNTLLGTVEERKDEIGMLNSVGLAPAHVGMLFLVEAVVYGVIGLVVGYLVGLMLAKLLLGNVAFMALIGAGGVSLNYSSGATIVSCALVLIIVVVSAMYPARQAKKMATPGATGRWGLPPSETGMISVEVPFTLTGGNALGMLGFMDEYLAQHTDATSPDFRVIRKRMLERVTASGSELVLTGESYLAPYDLGVSNSFSICMRPTSEPNILRVRFVIQRQGGDMTSYRRATQKFLDLLRQQFLIWRTLEIAEKQKYVERAMGAFATPGARQVEPLLA